MAGQGLLADPARKASPRSVLKQIEAMGFVQVDTINILVRAHEHILHTRFDDYQPRMLKKLLERDRSLFEHWTHDASIIPTSFIAQWKRRFARYAETGGRNPWWKQRMGKDAPRVLEHVLERIEREGPLMSRDFEHERDENESGNWWSWKPQKAALEYLWRCGKLAVSHRVNFHKAYDLAPRVLRELDDHETPSHEAHADWMCRQAMQRLGIASPSELAGFFGRESLADARRWCIAAAKRGEVVPVVVEGASTERQGASPRSGFALADWRRRVERLPEPPARMRLLSPFDPAIRDRKRLERLFNFDYRFEAFVPQRKRKYGYYVLPMLVGDRLVGRLDARVDRKAEALVVEGLWWESRVRPTAPPPRLRRELDEAIERLAGFVGANRVVMPR